MFSLFRYRPTVDYRHSTIFTPHASLNFLTALCSLIGGDIDLARPLLAFSRRLAQPCAVPEHDVHSPLNTYSHSVDHRALEIPTVPDEYPTGVMIGVNHALLSDKECCSHFSIVPSQMIL
jgi:hypothetical protein